jgi:outer membrane receptor protein involved in Fe transport
MGSPAHLAANFFADTPFSGQLNLLTTGTFDTPEQLFSPNNFAKGIAYLRLGAPVGGHADWTVRGALNQADISSWILAGSYTTRAPARHAYDIGMSYSTQRYDGGNPLALRDVTDGSRNAGALYGFDTFTITPALVLTYGGRYARYDYLDNRTLISPRVELTVKPTSHLRLGAQLSRREQAPGAEEFLPPADTGIWLPPQRTFSSLKPSREFEAERTTRMAVDVERDIAGSTISLSAFRQEVDDQLVTLFGVNVPDQPVATLGHYVVGNAGDVSATGCTASFRTSFADRVSGSIAYSITNARLEPNEQLHYLVLLAPSAVTPDGERIHDLSTAFETHVPETATRVLVLYRLSNGFAHPGSGPAAGLDARFDVQVRQALPFLNFTSAKWEMLVAVRNFFRETAPDQSVYDELLVVRPPKRIVGGVTMRF